MKDLEDARKEQEEKERQIMALQNPQNQDSSDSIDLDSRKKDTYSLHNDGKKERRQHNTTMSTWEHAIITAILWENGFFLGGMFIVWD